MRYYGIASVVGGKHVDHSFCFKSKCWLFDHHKGARISRETPKAKPRVHLSRAVFGMIMTLLRFNFTSHRLEWGADTPGLKETKSIKWLRLD